MPNLEIEAPGAPVLIFGGVYGNLQALEALMAQAETLGIGPDRMICTGDVAAYCADPEACARIIREQGIQTVMGNCEQQLGAGEGHCGCGFEAGSACERLARDWFSYCTSQISQATRRWMAQLPARIILNLAGRRFALVHGAPTRINRFIFPASPRPEKRRELLAAGGAGVIGGHSGLPFAELIDGHLWFNSGALGLPANDGTADGWYGLIWRQESDIHVATRRLAYDHRAAAARMREAGLPQDYAVALESGLWPSRDILPAGDRRRTGQPIQPVSLLLPGPATTKLRAS